MLVGKRGGEQIQYNCKDRRKVLKSRVEEMYWQCNQRIILKCPARLITTGDQPYSVIKEPEHIHQENFLGVAGLRSSVRSAALTSNEPTLNVVLSITNKADEETIFKCPVKQNLKRTVRKGAKKHPATVLTPTSYTQEEFTTDAAALTSFSIQKIPLFGNVLEMQEQITRRYTGLCPTR